MAPFVDSLQIIQNNNEGEPEGCIRPDGNLPDNKSRDADFNAGFHGKFSYLVATTGGSNPRFGKIEMQQYRTAQPGLGTDIAAGTGGDFRYLVPSGPDNNFGISEVALWRLDNSKGARFQNDAIAAGYDGISNDFNAGRKGDYLYVVWRNSQLS